jgi:hypothetical protein
MNSFQTDKSNGIQHDMFKKGKDFSVFTEKFINLCTKIFS